MDTGPIQKNMEAKLQEALLPQRFSLVNESHKHKVPQNSETHFNLIIVSTAFAGRSTLARHRTVYGIVDDELKGGVHALTMKTLTPEEWDAAGGDVTNPAPKCRGGTGK